MNSSSEITANADDCFEVDDIAAFDPIDATAPAKVGNPAKPAAKPSAKPKAVARAAKSPASTKGEDNSGGMEIELSADDMNSLLGDDVISVEIS
jgi:hypothetical protein